MDDPFFGPAFVDVDEWRDEQVRHRSVHGGCRFVHLGHAHVVVR